MSTSKLATIARAPQQSTTQQAEQKSPGFPRTRMRRNRTDIWTRRLVAENKLSADDLIWPVFIIEGKDKTQPIHSMPGVERYTVDLIAAQAERAAKMGIAAMALFPALDHDRKDPEGREALNPNGVVCQAIKAVKKAVPDMGVFCDVALDPFTDHAHDGLLVGNKILNDETIAILCQQAVMQAEAGCDVISPSDMMDGRVGAVRDALDAAGFQDVKICSYAAKYASGFYGPFRDALNNNGKLVGDKKTYQMDPANSDEAIREVGLDIAEGADMVMVKPGLPYLDIVYRVKETFGVPTFVYHVSGEYAMLKAAAQNGWLDYNRVMMESLLSFKRAGADAIWTYAALEAAEILRKG
jgi:porphobilinogen synthase